MVLNIVRSFISPSTKVVDSKGIKEQVFSGNVRFAKSIVSVKNVCAYRADTRSPETIRKYGFSGTNSIDPSEVRVFGDKTVFASGSKTGVETFIKTAGFTNNNDFCYLYKIKTSGHQVFSFSENFKKHSDELITGISCLANNTLELTKEAAKHLTKDAIQKDYLAVDELQIEGPIKPSSIKHIETIRMSQLRK